jgi:hypothetical protein
MNVTLTHPPRRSSQPVESAPGQEELSNMIMETIVARRECCLDSLVVACSRFTWNQVFLEVDRMSRSGKLYLRRTGYAKYSVSLPPQSAR